MPLEFRGVGILGPRKSAVRFAAYPHGREAPLIICEVSAEVIRSLCGANPTTEEALMEGFSKHSDLIRSLASAQFDSGNLRPKISLSDVVTRQAGIHQVHREEA